MVRKLLNILIGTINNLLGFKEELSSPRMKICLGCEYCKNVLLVGKVCSKCGCILRSKTRVKSEKCKLNKW